jgi:FkbM family methyltransferase
MSIQFKPELVTLSDRERAVIRRAANQIIQRRKGHESRRAVFVDCGFNTCKVLKGFIEFLPPEFRFFGFELQEDLLENARAVEKAHADRIAGLEIAAVAAKDGVVSYSRSKGSGVNYRGGTSISKDYLIGRLMNEQIEVRSIDFSAWLGRTVDANDFVVVKMDIEGAEYDVLEKLIADDHLRFINVLMVEFHARNFAQDLVVETEARQNRIIETIRADARTHLIVWH